MAKRRSVTSKPVKDFITFKDAQDRLGFKWPGSMENVLKNGSVRFHMASPDSAKIRMIYKPDVLALKKALDAE